MVQSVRASESGLAIVDRARRRQGWNKTAEAWCGDAFTSRATINRFWARQPIRLDTFIAICQAVGVDWETVVEAPESPTVLPESHAPPKPSNLRHRDWGEAPEPGIFCGRVAELATLEQWIVRDRCRLVAVLGMGGIGKTALAAKLAYQIEAEFEFVIWRSLRNAPPVEEILGESIRFLSEQQEVELSPHLDGKIRTLLQHLRSKRCLLILDNAESILQSGDVPGGSHTARAGRYRPGYEGYGQLLQCLGDSPHASCLLLTSRERPQGLMAAEGETLPVRCLSLKGIPTADGRTLFQAKGAFTGSESQWQSLIDRYAGNPLALKIVASAVRDCFEGNIGQFLTALQEGPFIFDDIRDLLEQQFSRLGTTEQEVMYWLAIAREPISFQALQGKFFPTIPASDLLQALVSLQHRSLVEKTATRFTQQSVVMEYATDRLIDRIGQEVAQPTPILFRSHALVEAHAKDYMRQTQVNLILQPTSDRLTAVLGSTQALEHALQQILANVHAQVGEGVRPLETGYLCGNLINLLRQVGADLSGYDFSYLTIWQANLQGLNLHDVNFTGADLSRSVFTETLGNILSAAFSPDGKLLATCDTDCLIRLWEVGTGKLLTICKGHHNWVRSVAFSPDSQLLVSASADRTVKFWHLGMGQCLKTCRQHQHEVFSVAVSPDGQTLVSSSGDRTICLWEIQTGECLSVMSGHSSWVRSVAFSPDGATVASGGDDGMIRLWDIHHGKCLNVLKGHESWVRSVAFSPDGQILASGSGDRTVRLWDSHHGECLNVLSGHRSGIYSVAFSGDGDLIASGSGDNTVRLWDRQTNHCIRTFDAHTNQICTVALSPDGQTGVCVSLDQTVSLWNYHTGQRYKLWQGHTDWALPVAFFPNETNQHLLVSGSNDCRVRLWDTRESQCLRILAGHTDQVFAIAVSPDGTTVASGSTDQTIRLWDSETGECLQVLLGHTDWLFAVAFSPDGTILASGSADRTLKLWDVKTGECLNTLSGHEDKIFGIAFAHHKPLLASGCSDKTVKVWDVTMGECLHTLSGHCDRVYSVSFAPDDNRLASCSTDETVKLWDLSTGECLKTLHEHENWVFSVAFSPDGETLASGSHDQTVKLWDVKTGKCRHTLTGHEHLVSSVSFSADSRVLASGSQDQTVRLWDVETGQCLNILRAARIYEGMNITEAIGLTPAQQVTLKALGAVTDAEQ